MSHTQNSALKNAALFALGFRQRRGLRQAYWDLDTVVASFAVLTLVSIFA